MKRNALIVGLALLTASTARMHRTSRLSADYPRQATPLIHWPQVVVKHDGGRMHVATLNFRAAFAVRRDRL
jgi:hypothetical protein